MKDLYARMDEEAARKRELYGEEREAWEQVVAARAAFHQGEKPIESRFKELARAANAWGAAAKKMLEEL